MSAECKPLDATAPVAPAAFLDRARQVCSLVQVFPEQDPLVLRVEADPLVIGRREPTSTVDVPLPDARVSRRHAEVRATEDGLYLKDLGSTNGSFVDGVRVASALVHPGQVVRLGDNLFVTCRDRPQRDPDDLGLLGHNAELARIRQVLRRVSPSALAVLIEGRTGTGKELIAQAIHRLSGRLGPMIPVNCAALAPNLVESSLFGHRRGAFTGAANDQVGAFRAAHGGTLFLDEVGDLPIDTQPKLLRALESGEITPVGSTQPVHVDVRVVAATNVPLGEATAAGRFREDLLARLLGVRVVAPPLLHRREDVLMLLRRMLQDAGSAARPTVAAAEALVLYDWPRNVRELRQLAQRLAVLHGDRELLELEHLGDEFQRTAAAATDAPSDTPPAEAQDDFIALEGPPSREKLVELLQLCGGNVSELARRARRSRKQVYRWLEAAGLDRGLDASDLDRAT
ncbi:MAG: sigma 54-interacting transcriptional regulator [Deltaproteobacteria bacterium]|nr:sigma 54-interacting transcriptional regulator [Deltaproteobacteria bacterium]